MNCLNCGRNISDSEEDGVNGSQFFSCEDCKLGFNVVESKLEEE